MTFPNGISIQIVNQVCLIGNLNFPKQIRVRLFKQTYFVYKSVYKMIVISVQRGNIE